MKDIYQNVYAYTVRGVEGNCPKPSKINSVLDVLKSSQHIHTKSKRGIRQFQPLMLIVIIGLFTVGFVQNSVAQIVNADCNTPTEWVNGTFDNLSVSITNGVGSTIPLCLGGFTGTGNVINSTTTDFATLSITGLGCDGELSVKDDDAGDTYPAGSFAGFEVGASGLLSVSVAVEVVVSTYNNGVLQEQKTVISSGLGLSTSLLNNNGNAVLGFVTTQDFDEIRIRYNALVGVLYTTQIYNAIIERFCSGPALSCNQETHIKNPDFPVVVNSDSTRIEGVCVGCSFNDAPNVIDSDSTNYAELVLSIGVAATGHLRVDDVLDDYDSGTFVGFDIENADLVGLNLLSGLTIHTYNDGVRQESAGAGTLLSLDLGLGVGSGRQVVGFITTLDFDAVELEVANLLGLLNTTRIYNVIFEEYCIGDTLVCNERTYMTKPDFPVVVDNVHTGIDGICVGCSVSDAGNVVNEDSTDYAQIIMSVGVAATGEIAVQDVLTDYTAGTFAGFEIENTELIGANLLSGLTVRTYLDGVLQETVTSGSLVSVSTGLLTDDGRQVVGFVTTMDFDEVKLEVENLLGVLSTTNVYGAIFQEFCAGDTLACNERTYMTSPEYPVVVNSRETGIDGVCVGCSVGDVDNVINEDTTDYAEIVMSVGVLASGELSVQDVISDYEIGTFAGFEIENSDLLGANLLSGLTVHTYLDGVLQESEDAVTGSLISVSSGLLSSSGRQIVGFITTTEFDEVKLEVENLLGALSTTRVYGAIFQEYCHVTDLECDTTFFLQNPDFPVLVNNARTGLGGVLCVGCSVSDAGNVVSSDTTDYANIQITAGVLATGSISVQDAIDDYPSGSIVGFAIEDLNLLVEATLLESIEICTYLDNVEQECASGANLLDLNVLIPILGPGPGVYNVGFQTTLQFDEIRLTIGDVAGVLNNVNVYSAYVDTRGVGEDELLSCCPIDVSMASVEVGDETGCGTCDGTIEISNANLEPDSTYTVDYYYEGGYVGGTELEADENGVLLIGNLCAGLYDSIIISDAFRFNCLDTLTGELEILEFCEGDTLMCNTPTYMVQPEYPVDINDSRTGVVGVLCLNCEVVDADNAINSDLGDYAQIVMDVGIAAVGSISVEEMVGTYTPGTFAGFDIENTDLVGVNLLSGLTVRTYLDGVLQETVTSGSLVSVSTGLLANSGRQTVGFVSTMSFDEVQISIENLLGALSTTNVYGAVFEEYCVGDTLVCNERTYMTKPGFPVVVDNVHTGIDGICVGCSVSDAGNVVNEDSTDYAQIIMSVGVAATGEIAVQDVLTDYTAGTFAGFEIENTELIGANLLSGLTVRTYLDGVLQETVTSGSLVSVSTGLLTDDGRQVVGFVTTMDFDEVKLEVENLLGVLSTTNVYGAIFQEFCAGDTLACNERTYMTSPEYPVVVNSRETGIDGVCVGCSVGDVDNVINEDTTDYAEIVISAGVLATGELSVKNVITDYDTLTFAGFDIENNLLIGANLLSGISVCTYLDGVQQECASGPGLVTVSTGLLAANGRQVVGLLPSTAYDEVKLEVENLLGVLSTTRVYGAVLENLCDLTELECDSTFYLSKPDFPLIVNNRRSGSTGVCVGCSVSNPYHVINSDTTDAANIQVSIGALGQAAISVQDAINTYPVGSTVGFVIEDVNTLLEATLLSSLTVCTYLDGVQQECETGFNLIDLNLLGIPIIGPIGSIHIGLETTLPYDEVQLSAGALVGVINNINVYGTFVDTRGVGDDPNLNCCTIDASSASMTITDLTGCQSCDGTMLIENANLVPDSTYEVNYHYLGDFVGAQAFTTDMTGAILIENLCAGSYDSIIISKIGGASCADTLVGPFELVQNCVNAIDDFNNTFEDLPVSGNVLTNDFDPEGDDMVCNTTPACLPTNGMVVINSDGSYTYTPNADFVGTDYFCYEVCDDGVPMACDEATVTIEVIDIEDPNNNPPVANIDAYVSEVNVTVLGDLLANDFDPDEDQIIVNTTPVELPNHGNVTINVNGTFSYVPSIDFIGKDTFSYEICDDGVPSKCDTALAYIEVIPNTGNITVAVDDAYFGPENEPISGNLLTNDFDPEMDDFSVSVAPLDDVSQGSVIVNSDGSFVYTPNEGFRGADQFTYVMCDMGTPSVCDTATVYLSVRRIKADFEIYAWLEGSMVIPDGMNTYGSNMRTTLNDLRLLPGQSYEDIFTGTQYSVPGQPYFEMPWNYMGSEGDSYDSGGDPLMGDANYPSTVTDWVLVSLRETPEGSAICKFAAFIHEDGSIESIEDMCDINSGAYYVVIEHRSHLLVMSDTAVVMDDGIIHHDFRQTQSYINDPLLLGIYVGQKEIQPGVFIMYAGNGDQVDTPNSDTDININDNLYWETQNGDFAKYLIGDYDMNGDVNLNDLRVWEQNNGKFTSVPRNE